MKAAPSVALYVQTWLDMSRQHVCMHSTSCMVFQVKSLQRLCLHWYSASGVRYTFACSIHLDFLHLQQVAWQLDCHCHEVAGGSKCSTDGFEFEL